MRDPGDQPIIQVPAVAPALDPVVEGFARKLATHAPLKGLPGEI